MSHPAQPALPERAARRADVNRALRLEWLTLAWMTVEASVALAAGLIAGSVVLEAFGIDSLIELTSAGVLIWRLVVELRRGGEFPEAIERRASRICALLLFALTTYVIVSGGVALWRHQAQQASIAGLLLTGAAIPLMSLLARAKLRLASTLGSAALRSDAVESLTCGYLSTVVFVSLVAQWLLGAWWVSGASALALAPFLFREAREAWSADTCCHCG
ncbi:MAG: cation transporter [Acidobacteriota bacterium]|nr:cation transporter [Acidobacteriota bacterium]